MKLGDSHRHSICNCWLTRVNNILRFIYGYVYDVSVFNFEQLSPINRELKTSNLHANVIPYITEETFVLSHTTEEWYTKICILYEDPVKVKFKVIPLQAWTRL